MKKLVSLFVLFPFALCAATYYATPNPTYDPDTGKEIATSAQTVGGDSVTAWSLTKCRSKVGNTGDTIILLKGTYDCTKLPQDVSGSLLQFKLAQIGASLVGETGDPKDVVLVGGGTENKFRAINIYGSSTRITVNSLTFTNFCSSSDGGVIYGAGGVANTVVTNCCFLNNTASRGGAIYFNNYVMEVWDCLFKGNRYTLVSSDTPTFGGGGAICGGGLSCTNCRFIDNGHPTPETYNRASGGAVWSACCTNCLFAGNTAYGAGAVGHGSSCYRCVISNNTAYATTGGDRMQFVVSSYVPCSWCDIIGNRNTGGAITGGKVDHCRYIGNVGVSVINGGGGPVRDSLFYGNDCTESGGGDGVLIGPAVYNCSCISNVHANRVLSGFAHYTPVVNVLFVGNVTTKGGTTLANPTRGFWNTYTNCVADKVTNSEVGQNWTVDAKVASYVQYGPDGVPCGIVRKSGAKKNVIDRGYDLGSAADDLDVLGKPRVFGAAVDIGCFEWPGPIPGLMLLLR